MEKKMMEHLVNNQNNHHHRCHPAAAQTHDEVPIFSGMMPTCTPLEMTFQSWNSEMDKHHHAHRAGHWPIRTYSSPVNGVRHPVQRARCHFKMARLRRS